MRGGEVVGFYATARPTLVFFPALARACDPLSLCLSGYRHGSPHSLVLSDFLLSILGGCVPLCLPLKPSISTCDVATTCTVYWLF